MSRADACAEWIGWCSKMSQDRHDCTTHTRTLSSLSTASRILGAIVLILSSYLPLFDSSPALLLSFSHSFTSRWLSTLLRWDAFHFLHIAQADHVFEHEWAFFKGTSYMMNLFRPVAWAQHILGLGIATPPVKSFLLSGALAVVFCDGTLTLYHLTHRIFKSSNIAFLAALLSLVPLSPATLRHAGYSESFFTYLSYQGMLYCSESYWLRASITFALASLFRSNGVLLCGFLIWGMLVDPIIHRKKVTVRPALCCITLTAVPTIIFLHHQFAAYQAFCKSDEPAIWCTRSLPFIYAYVQSQYWNVGFMRYWTIQQLPNFIISAPVLALLLYASTSHIYYGFYPRILTFVSEKLNRSGRPLPQHSAATTTPSSLFLSPAVTPHALHALFLTLTLIFAAHTQIVLRLAAALPFTYWSGAQLWVLHPRVARWWTAWSVVWGAVSLVLWGTFLPPA